MKPKYKVGDLLETNIIIGGYSGGGSYTQTGEIDFMVEGISHGKISGDIYYTDGFRHYYHEKSCRLKEDDENQRAHRKPDSQQIE